MLVVPGVDPLRSFSNNIHEMTNIFGVAAGRTTLHSEMGTVLMIDGNFIPFRHMDLLCGTISHRGYMCPVWRHAWRAPPPTRGDGAAP